MNDQLAIEIAPFQIAEGISPDALLDASDLLERDFLAAAEGYLGRVLVQKDAQTWADIVFWRSAQCAEKAMAAAVSSEVCRSYFLCMANSDHDDPAQGVALFTSWRRYGSILP